MRSARVYQRHEPTKSDRLDETNTAVPCLHRHEIGEGLQGVVQVGERVDDRNGGLSLELRHVRVVVNARQEQAVEPGQNLNRQQTNITFGFSCVLWRRKWKRGEWASSIVAACFGRFSYTTASIYPGQRVGD